MPIDPSLSLKTYASSGDMTKDAPANALAPILNVGKLAEIQNTINQNRLFQQTFHARQLAGQIMASAPSLEAGWTAIERNPETAAFAGEIALQGGQAQQLLTQIHGAQQEQNLSALGFIFKGLGPVLNNPSSWKDTIDTYTSVLPPETSKALAPGIESLRKSLLDDLPLEADGKPGDAAKAELRKRVGAVMMSSSITPDVIRASTGSLPPQVVTGPGSVPMVIGGPATASPNETNGLGGSTAQPQPQSAPASSMNAGMRAGDGKPLIDPSIRMISPSIGKGVGGLNILSTTQQAAAADLQAEFSTEGLKQFNNATASLASLRYMDNAFDHLAKGGGFLVPGTAANFRSDLAKVANTIAQITGQKLPFDPSKVASIEDFNKETKRMGLMVINQMLGGQREAAQIITGITQSVPGVENTYMGGKLVSAGIQAATQRAIDQRNFENTWQAQNQGNLTGAAEAFNKAHPADQYAKTVLDKFGLTEKGFSTPEAVRAAKNAGYLTQQQALDLLHEQFSARFKAKP